MGAEIIELMDVDDHFSDSETRVRLARDVSGGDVFLCQSLYHPQGQSVDQNYMALLIAARAFREWGANHVTAVVPYLAYARQDKSTPSRREPVTARLMADLAITAGIDRFVTWHPHSSQIRGFYGSTPIHVLDATRLFVEAFRRFQNQEDVVVVAPDAGAIKLVTAVSQELGLQSAIGSKYRPEPEVAAVTQLLGDFTAYHTAIVLDDIISSGGTVAALIRKLVTETEIDQVHLAVSHNLCTQQAQEHLLQLHEQAGLRSVFVTDTIPQTEAYRSLPFLTVRNLAPWLGGVINRLHYGNPAGEQSLRPGDG